MRIKKKIKEGNYFELMNSIRLANTTKCEAYKALLTSKRRKQNKIVLDMKDLIKQHFKESIKTETIKDI